MKFAAGKAEHKLDNAWKMLEGETWHVVYLRIATTAVEVRAARGYYASDRIK